MYYDISGTACNTTTNQGQGGTVIGWARHGRELRLSRTSVSAVKSNFRNLLSAVKVGTNFQKLVELEGV